MVREGNFTVELVSADTHIPFKEHTGPDGKVYAEVEPDMDFFIKYRSDDAEGKPFRSSIKVDGEALGYNTEHHSFSAKTATRGIWESQGGNNTMTAFRFAKTDGSFQSDSVEPSFGSVEVTFTRLTLPENSVFLQKKERVNSWVGGKALVNATISEIQDKVVRSKEGRKTFSEEHTPSRNYVYDVGLTLATIELRYCTTVGLILAGVLPKPPGWASRRHGKKAQEELSSSMRKCLAVEPSSVVVVHENVALGIHEVRADVFDLVEADISDDEEEGEFGLIKNVQNLEL